MLRGGPSSAKTDSAILGGGTAELRSLSFSPFQTPQPSRERLDFFTESTHSTPMEGRWSGEKKEEVDVLRKDREALRPAVPSASPSISRNESARENEEDRTYEQGQSQVLSLSLSPPVQDRMASPLSAPAPVETKENPSFDPSFSSSSSTAFVNVREGAGPVEAPASHSPSITRDPLDIEEKGKTRRRKSLREASSNKSQEDQKLPLPASSVREDGGVPEAPSKHSKLWRLTTPTGTSRRAKLSSVFSSFSDQVNTPTAAAQGSSSPYRSNKKLFQKKPIEEDEASPVSSPGRPAASSSGNNTPSGGGEQGGQNESGRRLSGLRRRIFTGFLKKAGGGPHYTSNASNSNSSSTSGSTTVKGGDEKTPEGKEDDEGGGMSTEGVLQRVERGHLRLSKEEDADKDHGDGSIHKERAEDDGREAGGKGRRTGGRKEEDQGRGGGRGGDKKDKEDRNGWRAEAESARPVTPVRASSVGRSEARHDASWPSSSSSKVNCRSDVCSGTPEYGDAKHRKEGESYNTKQSVVGGVLWQQHRPIISDSLSEREETQHSHGTMPELSPSARISSTDLRGADTEGVSGHAWGLRADALNQTPDTGEGSSQAPSVDSLPSRRMPSSSSKTQSILDRLRQQKKRQSAKQAEEKRQVALRPLVRCAASRKRRCNKGSPSSSPPRQHLTPHMQKPPVLPTSIAPIPIDFNLFSRSDEKKNEVLSRGSVIARSIKLPYQATRDQRIAAELPVSHASSPADSNGLFFSSTKGEPGGGGVEGGGSDRGLSFTERRRFVFLSNADCNGRKTVYRFCRSCAAFYTSPLLS